jgi:hypothetical protein
MTIGMGVSCTGSRALMLSAHPERQRDRRAPSVSMPHWGGIISSQDLQALVAYLGALKS